MPPAKCTASCIGALSNLGGVELTELMDIEALTNTQRRPQAVSSKGYQMWRVPVRALTLTAAFSATWHPFGERALFADGGLHLSQTPHWSHLSTTCVVDEVGNGRTSCRARASSCAVAALATVGGLGPVCCKGDPCLGGRE